MEFCVPLIKESEVLCITGVCYFLPLYGVSTLLPFGDVESLRLFGNTVLLEYSCPYVKFYRSAYIHFCVCVWLKSYFQLEINRVTIHIGEFV